jgi:hypothetical protein
MTSTENIKNEISLVFNETTDVTILVPIIIIIIYYFSNDDKCLSYSLIMTQHNRCFRLTLAIAITCIDKMSSWENKGTLLIMHKKQRIVARKTYSIRRVLQCSALVHISACRLAALTEAFCNLRQFFHTNTEKVIFDDLTANTTNTSNIIQSDVIYIGLI